jgi:hypothetical protein
MNFKPRIKSDQAVNVAGTLAKFGMAAQKVAQENPAEAGQVMAALTKAHSSFVTAKAEKQWIRNLWKSPEAREAATELITAAKTLAPKLIK